MLGQAFQCFPCQVQAIEPWVPALQFRHDAQGVAVVIKATPRRHHPFQRILTAMPERRVAQIMRQRQRLGEILVDTERAGQAAGDLRHFQAMGETHAEMITIRRDKHLRLVAQPAERAGMDDPVTIARKRAARRRCRLRVQPPA